MVRPEEKIIYAKKGSGGIGILIEPRQANLCLRAFRHYKF